MTHDTEALVATLQLLLGDADDDTLHKVLANAFWPRSLSFNKEAQAKMFHDLDQATKAIRVAAQQVGEPPLGRLACNQVKQELDAALLNLSRLQQHFISPINPKR